MFTCRNRRRKKERYKLEKKKRLVRDRIIRDIRTLFKQEEYYYIPKRVSNFWNNKYIQYESDKMMIKIETYFLMNILTKLKLIVGT